MRVCSYELNEVFCRWLNMAPKHPVESAPFSAHSMIYGARCRVGWRLSFGGSRVLVVIKYGLVVKWFLDSRTIYPVINFVVSFEYTGLLLQFRLSVGLWFKMNVVVWLFSPLVKILGLFIRPFQVSKMKSWAASAHLRHVRQITSKLCFWKNVLLSER